VIPGWIFQPIFTYVWNPSGEGSIAAAANGEIIRNATVVGFRSMWSY
jgi:hypothetical protein